MDTRRGNVFYDVKETRIIKGDWLFPDKEVTIVRKGIKVLDRTASLTLCEAIVRYANFRQWNNSPRRSGVFSLRSKEKRIAPKERL